jgi:superfamily I DNA/RNA helicase
MVKDQFYGIDELKEKYGLQTEAEWQEALDELGNEDIRKITKLIKAGEDLSGTPRISISTIHGVKGNERENVVINTELSGAAYDEYQKNPDDTHRLFYVACTRTENNLFIIETSKDLFKGTTYNSLEEQVGGKHYRSMKIQPAEFINENKLLFAEGNAIKYICRHQSKGKEQDIKKAIHYLEMILERDYS